MGVCLHQLQASGFICALEGGQNSALSSPVKWRLIAVANIDIVKHLDFSRSESSVCYVQLLSLYH